MKRLIIICLATVLTTTGFSQEVDSRLLTKFSKDELKELKANDPEQYTFIYQCLDYGFYLANFNGKSLSKEVRGEIEVADINNINFFSLGLEPEENRYLYYKIKGHDKLLVIRSIGHIKMEATKAK